MVSFVERIYHFEHLADKTKEFDEKLRTVVRMERPRLTILEDPLIDEGLRQVFRLDVFLGHDMFQLSETLDNHQDESGAIG